MKQPPRKRLLLEGAISHRTPVLLRIAQDHLSRALEHEPTFSKLKALRRKGKLDGAELRSFRRMNSTVEPDALVAIAFAAMALESCLYVMVLSECAGKYKEALRERVRDNGRLQTLQRWTLMIELLTGQRLPPTSKLWKALDATNRSRNRVVHSQGEVLTLKAIRRLKQRDSLRDAKDGIESLRAFAAFMRPFHPNLLHILLPIA